MRIVSWNVNGARAIVKKDAWLDMLELEPDVLCLQETKCGGRPLPGVLESWPLLFRADAERKGYSGVTTLCMDEEVRAPVLEDGELDTRGLDLTREGRCVITHHEVRGVGFELLNVYFPNGGRSDKRFDYKLSYYADICMYLEESDIPVVVCGDFNTAHRSIDLHDPVGNRYNSGFTDIEREYIDVLMTFGLVDVWRETYPDSVRYTWWDYRTRARRRGRGWRIDYFLVDERLLDLVESVEIYDEIEGSDHCPISLTLG